MYNLIGIHTNVLYSSLDDFSEKGYYYAIPYIIYKFRDEDPVLEYIPKPFEMFRRGMLLRDIESIIKHYGNSSAFLQISGSSFRIMTNYLARNMERVLADMVSCVIIKLIKKASLKNDTKNIFFINNTLASDKLLGRLGYLCLNLHNNLISIVSYKPESLMTNITSGSNDTLQFDIDFFKKDPDQLKSDPYPDNIMDSLTQTLFFKVAPESPAPLLPLRVDIFSQGLFNISKQIKCLSEIFQDIDNLSMPFQTSVSSEAMARIPDVLYKCIDADATSHKNIIREALLSYTSRGKAAI